MYSMTDFYTHKYLLIYMSLTLNDDEAYPNFFSFFCSISNVVFYFSQHENGDGSCKKGDFVFVCEHTIELVSKACLVIKNIKDTLPEIHIAPS